MTYRLYLLILFLDKPSSSFYTVYGSYPIILLRDSKLF